MGGGGGGGITYETSKQKHSMGHSEISILFLVLPRQDDTK